MNNHINYSRVRRIKSVIYAVIVLLFLVPAVLLIVLGAQMIQYLGPIREIIAQNQLSQAGPPISQQDENPFLAAAPLVPEPEPVFPVPPSLSQTEDEREAEGSVPMEDALAPEDDPQLLGQIAFPRLQLDGAGEAREAPSHESDGQGGADAAAEQPGNGEVRIPSTGLPRGDEK